MNRRDRRLLGPLPAVMLLGLFGAAPSACSGCNHGWRTVTATSPVAFQDDKSVFGIVGAGASPGEGAFPKLNAVPSNRYFDASGYPIEEVNGQIDLTEEAKKQISAQLSAKYMDVCAGKIGVSAESTRVSNARMVVTKTFSVRDDQRRYEGRLASCCNNPGPDCSAWIVNRAFKTRVEWDASSTSTFSANGEVTCGDSMQTPVAAAASASTTADGGTDSATASDSGAAPDVGDAGGAESGVASGKGIGLQVATTSADKKTAKLSSEGWNVVELIPLKQVCQEWVRVCDASTNDEAKKTQYLCDRIAKK